MQLLVMAEPEMAEGDNGLTDHERLLSLEIELRGFRELVKEQRRSDNNQVLQIASAHDRFASAADQEKLEARVNAIENKLTEMVPRSTIDARFDGLQARQESITGAMHKMETTFIQLHEELSASSEASEKQEKRHDSRLALRVGVATVCVAALGLLVGIFFDLNSKPSSVPTVVIQQPASTTTTVAGHG